MAKNIDTLVKDIYSTLESGAFEIDADKLAAMIKARFSEDKRGGSLRMSNLGTPCKKKLWYTVNKPELAEPLTAPTLIKFLLGDIIEEVALTLAEAAGHEVEGRQTKLEIGGVKGHRDALIDGMLVDVKSANSRSFGKFRYHKLRDEDPFAYLTQLALYYKASKDKKIHGEAAFLAVDKELGHIVLDKYAQDERYDWDAFVERQKDMVQQKDPPARSYSPKPDGKSGNMVIPMECRYCPFKTPCWQETNGGKGLQMVVFSNGPRWFTKVVRTPNPRASS